MAEIKKWHMGAARELYHRFRYMVRPMSLTDDSGVDATGSRASAIIAQNQKDIEDGEFKIAQLIASHDPSNADRKSEIGGVDVENLEYGKGSTVSADDMRGILAPKPAPATCFGQGYGRGGQMTDDSKAVTPATDKWRIGYKDGSGPEYIVADDPKCGESAILTIRWGCSCCKDTIEKFDELTDKEQQIMREIVTAQSTIDQLKAENERLRGICGGADVEKMWVRLCALDKVRPNPDTTDTVLVTKKSLRAAIKQAQKGKP